MKIILASASPRRLELLRILGHEIRAIHPDIKEVAGGDVSELISVASINARNKAEHVFARLGLIDADIIISADTIVVYENQLFGKPHDAEEAQSMLAQLSGRTHQVITAFCVIGAQGRRRESRVISQVTFRALNTAEIVSYVGQGESLDKAGGYGVQGAGAALIDNISGSITNVIGLPIVEVLHEAKLIIAGS